MSQAEGGAGGRRGEEVSRGLILRCLLATLRRMALTQHREKAFGGSTQRAALSKL